MASNKVSSEHHHNHHGEMQQKHDEDDQLNENCHHQSSNTITNTNINNNNNNNNQSMFSFGMMQSSSSSSSAAAAFNISKESGGGAYDLGELDQALFLYLDAQDQRQNTGMRPHTLNIFPSEPMHVEPSPKPLIKGSKKSAMELSNPRNDVASAPQPPKVVKREGYRKGPTSSSEQDGPKTPDPKTLRRLAQNREAARKSRLRKKAYVQQLESSRMKLTQLEHEVQRARAQGFFLGGNANLAGDQGLPNSATITSDAALFDMEYARWLEEHHRLTVELRGGVLEHRPENELRILLENCLAHYDEIFKLKNVVLKSDVFHIFSGMWQSPAERCFMWMGGFRPSELIKIMVNQIEAVTEQQMVGIYGLQQSTQEAEEALSHGLEALNQSLTETIICDSLSLPPNINTYMAQMAVAINKLSTLEGFVRQADNLRHQTLHRLQQLLTIRQGARCFLAIAEYFHRLRSLSSLWLGRPRHE